MENYVWTHLCLPFSGWMGTESAEKSSLIEHVTLNLNLNLYCHRELIKNLFETLNKVYYSRDSFYIESLILYIIINNLLNIHLHLIK